MINKLERKIVSPQKHNRKSSLVIINKVSQSLLHKRLPRWDTSH